MHALSAMRIQVLERMYVCMYVCICVCVCIYKHSARIATGHHTCVERHENTGIGTYVCMHVCVYVCIQAFARIATGHYACVERDEIHVLERIYVYTCTHTLMNIQAHTHRGILGSYDLRV